ncbi:MAG: SMP-30/gluconolactonase/LRE family protein [Planctomycetaceae bacterium]|nr:SMP-30/gluconolactonase/LRE family protein [Planctomycetaceae bacterium]
MSDNIQPLEPSHVTAPSRRSFLAASAAAVFAMNRIASGDEYAADAPPVRYPDPRLISLDSRFDALKLGNTPIQRIYHSKQMLWAEGPAWNAVGRYLLWSDIPNNLQHRWLEEDGHVSVMRNPAQNSNGNTFDWQGRQISCEHLTRSVVRYEHDGTRTVLANSFDGKSLNAPNDAVVHPNGDIWFTDPGYGGLMDYEGELAETGSVQPYQKEAIYRIDSSTGNLTKVADDIFKPNGLCFSPDYTLLYAADTGASHYEQARKEIRVWNVADEKSLTNGRTFASMNLEISRDGKTETVAGMADGIRCDVHGNIWSSAGWVGDGYDGVHVFAAEDGQRIGQILLPEICSNVCFGGTKRNRLFMTASQSVYAVYVNVRGAHIT